MQAPKDLVFAGAAGGRAVLSDALPVRRHAGQRDAVVAPTDRSRGGAARSPRVPAATVELLFEHNLGQRVSVGRSEKRPPGYRTGNPRKGRSDCCRHVNTKARAEFGVQSERESAHKVNTLMPGKGARLEWIHPRMSLRLAPVLARTKPQACSTTCRYSATGGFRRRSV
ncbi:hypothetical protein GCM10023322_55110 [Rugosimonospora acidiphila]|uniref:Uncharacterized protein n=1 Tax=Rugosimonospora acidiphila TaxID=556531 RepID=A0ABP9SD29_9ACTN